MNICVLAGRLVRNGIIRGTDKKVLLFTLETRDGRVDGEQKERVNFVPCVVFNPSPELEQKLVVQGKGLYVELEGRIASSSYEANGDKKYQTEVIVFNRSLTFVKD